MLILEFLLHFLYLWSCTKFYDEHSFYMKIEGQAFLVNPGKKTSNFQTHLSQNGLKLEKK